MDKFEKHLIKNGELKYLNSRERDEGVRMCFNKYEISTDKKNFLNFSTNSSQSYTDFAYINIKKQLEENKDITAIFFTGFLFLIGGLKAIHELKLKIPDDISIISFDDFPELHMYPIAISTVSQPIKTMGKKAIDFLSKRITGETGSPFQKIYKCKLLIRDSVKTI